MKIQSKVSLIGLIHSSMKRQSEVSVEGLVHSSKKQQIICECQLA